MDEDVELWVVVVAEAVVVEEEEAGEVEVMVTIVSIVNHPLLSSLTGSSWKISIWPK